MEMRSAALAGPGVPPVEKDLETTKIRPKCEFPVSFLLVHPEVFLLWGQMTLLEEAGATGLCPVPGPTAPSGVCRPECLLVSLSRAPA